MCMMRKSIRIYGRENGLVSGARGLRFGVWGLLSMYAVDLVGICGQLRRWERVHFGDHSFMLPSSSFFLSFFFTNVLSPL
jgi:hypothetical protein